MKECSVLEIKQIFTCYNNPKGNADTERVIRTIKKILSGLKSGNHLLNLKMNLKPG